MKNPNAVPAPNGCRYSGTDRASHLQRWTPGEGWHVWVEPTDEQRKARMLARRNSLPVIEVPTRCPECSHYSDAPHRSSSPLCSTCRPNDLPRPDASDAAFKQGPILPTERP